MRIIVDLLALAFVIGFTFVCSVIAIGVIDRRRKRESYVEPLPEPAPEVNWIDQRITRRIIVHTTEDNSIEGLLLSTWPDGVVLGSALYLDGESVQLGGDVWVPRSKIAMIQYEPKD